MESTLKSLDKYLKPKKNKRKEENSLLKEAERKFQIEDIDKISKTNFMKKLEDKKISYSLIDFILSKLSSVEVDNYIFRYKNEEFTELLYLTASYN